MRVKKFVVLSNMKLCDTEKRHLWSQWTGLLLNASVSTFYLKVGIDGDDRNAAWKVPKCITV
eukprot:gene8401-5882_t